MIPGVLIFELINMTINNFESETPQVIPTTVIFDQTSPRATFLRPAIKKSSSRRAITSSSRNGNHSTSASEASYGIRTKFQFDVNEKMNKDLSFHIVLRNIAIQPEYTADVTSIMKAEGGTKNYTFKVNDSKGNPYIECTVGLTFTPNKKHSAKLI